MCVEKVVVKSSRHAWCKLLCTPVIEGSMHMGAIT